jgi:hypothetical protein
MERVKGIEPSSSAWKAVAPPDPGRTCMKRSLEAFFSKLGSYRVARRSLDPDVAR